jgi:tRNA/rRNA methyltransferase
MAGTDRTRAPTAGGPAVILVQPQLGENIGTAARAMANFGLTDLRLVNPRDGWPSEKALSASSGAVAVIEGARLYDDTAAAIADLRRVYAATTRHRDMIKPVVTPAAAAAEMRARPETPTGVLFGPERAGLDNDDVALADTILAIPANPASSSLNLAMAVAVTGYEWFLAGDDTPERHLETGVTRPATKAELLGFFEHLERELDACGFLRVTEKRPTMVRNIRNLFQRAELTEQEVRSLRGIVSGLVDHSHRSRD